MGTKGSKLTNHEMEDLLKLTKLNRREIKKWYKKFSNDHPTGYLSLPAFTEMYSKMSSGVNDEDFPAKMFKVFDLNKDNRIDFREFMIVYSLYNNGTLVEKINWICNLYASSSQSNGIEEEELLQIIKCVYLMENKNEDTQVAEIRAHDIYQRIIGSVTKDEDK